MKHTLVEVFKDGLWTKIIIPNSFHEAQNFIANRSSDDSDLEIFVRNNEDVMVAVFNVCQKKNAEAFRQFLTDYFSNKLREIQAESGVIQ